MGLSVPETARPLWKTVWFMASMVAFLVFANWAAPALPVGFWAAVYRAKWVVAGLALASTILSVHLWFDREERAEWYASTWSYALQVLPLLFGGVLVAGFLFGRPGHEALISNRWVALVRQLTLRQPFAAVVGAFMYFATLRRCLSCKRSSARDGRRSALRAALAGRPFSAEHAVIQSVSARGRRPFMSLWSSFSTHQGDLRHFQLRRVYTLQSRRGKPFDRDIRCGGGRI